MTISWFALILILICVAMMIILVKIAEKAVDRLVEKIEAKNQIIEELEAKLGESINQYEEVKKEKDFIDKFLEDKIIKRKISSEERKKRYFENISKGKAFEKFTAEHYRKKGYEVEERGLTLKRKDGGIDLIAKKDDTIILIQCKNYAPHNKIDHVKIKEFNSNCLVYVESNRLDKDKVDFRFAISNGECLDKSAVMFFKDKTNKCRYEIVKY